MTRSALLPKSVSLQVDSNVEQIAPDVFGFTGILLQGKRWGIPARMTVIRLPSTNQLIVYSPFDPALVDLDRLGVVRAIIAPNTCHYMYAQRFKRAHPQATLYTSVGIQRRFPQWDWGVVLDENSAEDIISTQVLVKTMSSLRELKEVLLLHVPSGTVVSGDLACNITPRQVARLPIGGRLYFQFTVPLNALDVHIKVRSLIKADCARLLPELKSVLDDWEWDRMIPCHGEVVHSGAKEMFRRGTYAFVSERVG